MAVSNQERAILVGLDLKSRPRKGAPETPPFTAEESLDELKTLAESAGASVEEAIIQARPAPNAARAALFNGEETARRTLASYERALAE